MTIIAKWNGRCFVCRKTWEPGDEIDHNGSAWVHANCASVETLDRLDPDQVLTRLNKKVDQSPTCPKCHLRKPCICD